MTSWPRLVCVNGLARNTANPPATNNPAANPNNAYRSHFRLVVWWLERRRPLRFGLTSNTALRLRYYLMLDGRELNRRPARKEYAGPPHARPSAGSAAIARTGAALETPAIAPPFRARYSFFFSAWSLARMNSRIWSDMASSFSHCSRYKVTGKRPIP